MTDAPERIWADVNEVTLCGSYDVEPFDDAVEFVRADLSAAPADEVRRAALMEALQVVRDEIDLARTACKTTAKVLAIVHGNLFALLEKDTK